jgi:hypothetical protein
MTDMVTRVARAIAGEMDYDYDDPAVSQFKGTYLRMAHAAIEAMRTPTEDMGRIVRENCGGFSDSRMYRAFIDAALKEDE